MTEDHNRHDRVSLGETEIRRRVSGGVFYLASSGMTGLLLGFGGNLVLARLLTPADFGYVAVGATIATFGGAIMEGGLGSGLIRRPEPPTRATLRTLNGVQLLIALAFCLPTAAISLEFGTAGAVTALMIMSLPIETLGTPGSVVMGRQLQYDRIAAVNLISLASSQIFAIVAVALGAGVWGLAGAAVVKSVGVVVAMAIVGPGIYGPSLARWRELLHVMRFGLRFQSNWFVTVLGDQALNGVIGWVAGVNVLGQWSLAKKFLQAPGLLFNSLTGVVFPAVSTLVAQGGDPHRFVFRAVRIPAIAATTILVPFAAASSELVPLLFGAKWAEASEAVPLAVFAVLISGPTVSSIGGYLFAVGKTAPVIGASAVNAVLLVASAGILLPTIGLRGIGVGCVVGAVGQLLVLDWAARRTAGFSPARAMVAPIVAGGVSGAVGVAIATTSPRSLIVAVVAGAVSLGLDLGILAITCRTEMMDALRLSLGSVRDAVSRRRKPVPPEFEPQEIEPRELERY